MKRTIALLLCALLLTGCSTPLAQNTADAYTFTDDTNTPLRVPYNPKTVAVLTSSLADLWLTAGGQVNITVYESVERGITADNVILVDDGAGKTIDLERLIAAKPDLVLYSGDLSGQLSCAQVLHDAGIPAAGFHVETFQDYLRVLKHFTDILQTPDRYEIHGVKLKEKVDGLLAAAASREAQPSILFVRAGSSAKYTKAKTADNHFVCFMLKELGTNNIADAAPVLLDGLSMEQILVADPDWILFTTMGDESAGTAYMKSLVEDPVWQSLRAVRNDCVHQLPKELFQYKPNARWDQAYTYLINLLYGDSL